MLVYFTFYYVPSVFVGSVDICVIGESWHNLAFLNISLRYLHP